MKNKGKLWANNGTLRGKEGRIIGKNKGVVLGQF